MLAFVAVMIVLLLIRHNRKAKTFKHQSVVPIMSSSPHQTIRDTPTPVETVVTPPYYQPSPRSSQVPTFTQDTKHASRVLSTNETPSDTKREDQIKMEESIKRGGLGAPPVFNANGEMVHYNV